MPVVDLSGCTVCSNGLLVMMKRVDSGSVFAECEECMTGYWRPNRQDTFRVEEVEWDAQPASMAEVLAEGWPLPEDRP